MLLSYSCIYNINLKGIDCIAIKKFMEIGKCSYV